MSEHDPIYESLIDLRRADADGERAFAIAEGIENHVAALRQQIDAKDALIGRLNLEIGFRIKANEELVAGVRYTLDLLRTGLAPDAFNMDEGQWNQHKVWKASAELAALLQEPKPEVKP